MTLVPVGSKLFESLILTRVSTFLTTCVNQFGFKKHNSTEMLIFLLKELFRHYIAKGSAMYVTMLDASKVFEKVNHSKLFTKLIDWGSPSFTASILYYWYSTQTFSITGTALIHSLLLVQHSDILYDWYNTQTFSMTGTALRHSILLVLHSDILYDWYSTQTFSITGTALIHSL